MPEPEQSVEEIISSAWQMLRNAEIAVDKLLTTHDPERKISNFSNSAVWARGITPIVQRLRSKAPGLDQWYEPWRAKMESDPFLRYVYDLRNKLLKEGLQRHSVTTVVHSFSSADIRSIRPPGTVSFFMGDRIGGNGWIVQLPDGTQEKIYVDLPRSLVQNWLTLDDVPDEAFGRKHSDKTIENVSSTYVDFMREFISDAQRTFAPGASIHRARRGPRRPVPGPPPPRPQANPSQVIVDREVIRSAIRKHPGTADI